MRGVWILLRYRCSIYNPLPLRVMRPEVARFVTSPIAPTDNIIVESKIGFESDLDFALQLWKLTFWDSAIVSHPVPVFVFHLVPMCLTPHQGHPGPYFFHNRSFPDPASFLSSAWSLLLSTGRWQKLWFKITMKKTVVNIYEVLTMCWALHFVHVILFNLHRYAVKYILLISPLFIV